MTVTDSNKDAGDQEVTSPPTVEGPREKFLLAMYGQLWNNINRHVLLVWQPVTTLAATLALLSLVEKKVFGLDVATSLAVIVASWMIAHTMDASTWFNRNQGMIGYIEEVFLTKRDIEKLGSFVGKPRKNNKPILHFLIQSFLGIAVMGLMLAHHFFQRVLPSFKWWGVADGAKWMPYALCVLSIICLRIIWRKCKVD